MGVGRASFSSWLPAELSFCRIGCLGHLKEVGLLYYLVDFFLCMYRSIPGYLFSLCQRFFNGPLHRVCCTVLMITGHFLPATYWVLMHRVFSSWLLLKVLSSLGVYLAMPPQILYYKQGWAPALHYSLDSTVLLGC